MRRTLSRISLTAAVAASLCLLLAPAPAVARRSNESKKLPSPEKIVGEYVKALGGKKRLAALRDATYEWDVSTGDGATGKARTRLRNPSSFRTDLSLTAGESVGAANARAAWAVGGGGHLQTLTGEEALAARLQSLLEAGGFADYKKQKVLARTVAREEVGGEPAYLVEFSTRAGARLRYWFGATSRVPLQMADDARRLRVRFGDWRQRAGSPVLAEPHRLEIERDSPPALTLTLREARYNTGLAESLFEPPPDASLDIPALLRDLARNQNEVDRRVNDYTFTHKVTERELTDKGEVKKEKVSVYEVYPIVGWGAVEKLVSVNGVPLKGEAALKEAKRVAEEIEKAERKLPEVERKRERRRAERAAEAKKKRGSAAGEGEGEDDLSISTFLRAAEFVSPRRERFRDRDTIVFDFRPRPGFKPSSREEEIVSKLSGVVWIDPAERQVVRLEARLVEGFKMGGGLVASIKPGSAFVFEQMRLPDGVWLPRYSQVNASARVFLFAGISINETHEFGDYKRFSADAGEDKLDSPRKPDADEQTEEKPAAP